MVLAAAIREEIEIPEGVEVIIELQRKTIQLFLKQLSQRRKTSQ